MAQDKNLAIRDVTDLVNQIFAKAIEQRASDIHIEPEDDTLNVRLRIDGLLYLVDTYAKELKDSIISRIKVMSLLDITEHRLPQDGHVEFKYKERVHNMRIATFPTSKGEAVVLRILDREDVVMGIGDLGLDDNQLATVQTLISNPFGIILTTGPTGSGKTSFLYSIISALGSSDKNIVTVEDPIEFNIPGIRQTQVKESIGLDFSKAMRSIARQDPNIVMLGEIRDADTAHMVFQAALSGVLVLTTFHTFDVPGLVIRLLEMSIPKSVLAHAIKGVISIRLVRKICQQCKSPKPFMTSTGQYIQLKTASPTEEKCHLCHDIGYYGRIGLFEIIPFDTETQLKIMENIPSAELQNFFQQKQHKGLWESAADKVNAGITTVEEVTRVLGLEPR